MSVAVLSIVVSDGLGDLFPEGVLLSVWEHGLAPEELSNVSELHDSPNRVALARNEALLDCVVASHDNVIRFRDSEVYGAVY
jgi:hypothetical protein